MCQTRRADSESPGSGAGSGGEGEWVDMDDEHEEEEQPEAASSDSEESRASEPEEGGAEEELGTSVELFGESFILMYREGSDVRLARLTTAGLVTVTGLRFEVEGGLVSVTVLMGRREPYRLRGPLNSVRAKLQQLTEMCSVAGVEHTPLPEAHIARSPFRTGPPRSPGSSASPAPSPPISTASVTPSPAGVPTADPSPPPQLVLSTAMLVEWQCPVCTLINTGVNHCLACRAPRPHQHVPETRPPTEDEAVRRLQRVGQGHRGRKRLGGEWLRISIPAVITAVRKWELGHPLRLFPDSSNAAACLAAVVRVLVVPATDPLLTQGAVGDARTSSVCRGHLQRLRDLHTYHAAEGTPMLPDSAFRPRGWWPDIDLRKFVTFRRKRDLQIPTEGSPARRRTPPTVLMLRLLPICVPSHARVILWHEWREHGQRDFISCGKRMRRGRILQDGLNWLSSLSPYQLRGDLVPRFTKEIGAGEGVLRDFLSTLCSVCFRPSEEGEPASLFKQNSRNLLVPAGDQCMAKGFTPEQVRSAFHAAGRALGVALLRGISVSVPLARCVRRALLGAPLTPRDLESYDPELFRGLASLLALGKEDLEGLELEFEAAETAPAADPEAGSPAAACSPESGSRSASPEPPAAASGDAAASPPPPAEPDEGWETENEEMEEEDEEDDWDSGSVEPDADDQPAATCGAPPHPPGTPVTIDNVQDYVAWEARRRMLGVGVVSVGEQMDQFRRGFADVIPGCVVRLFDDDEWKGLLSPGRIDLADWEANTGYAGGYKPGHRIVRWFWNCVRRLSEEDQRRLLHFATGSEAPPHQGFSGLSPSFSLVRGRERAERLPTAATCFHQMTIPAAYSSEDELYAKLVTAIRNAKGFGLV